MHFNLRSAQGKQSRGFFDGAHDHFLSRTEFETRRLLSNAGCFGSEIAARHIVIQQLRQLCIT
jgi:hypothetical protein